VSKIPRATRGRRLMIGPRKRHPSKPLFGLGVRGGKSIRPASSEPIKRKVRKPPPPDRRLRVYALDPSIGKSLDSMTINETTLSVPWDETYEKLQPGPVGEYLEVVDIDPASNKVYEPVDLNDAFLLAQDGWSPSEGNPQFHQQMVYAVGMTTIHHFEQAIGRKTLWASRGSTPVERLRIYPHALRTDNAYYSPEKKALLFGYFPSESGAGDATAHGSMVFSCLSSDIVAHEMTHALLDGMHRHFEDASNLDVPAFHEGFADIVALFQHFTMPELVRFEIARTRGSLSTESLLSGLAKQFGEGSGRRGPLRDYLKPDRKTYPEAREAHDRGSILVYAVYDAFRRIVERRTADLIRLATGGSGILAAGAIHPDLVQRLTFETCKAARHVLRMCIRALDYCPTVDITFGEYLRAIITADLDFVKDDEYGYRIAFMESFRKWNLLPSDMRTVSEETLAWNTPSDPKPKWLEGILDTDTSRFDKEKEEPKDYDKIVFKYNSDLTRTQIADLDRKNRMRLWRRLSKAFRQNPKLYAEFGLLPGVPRFKADLSVMEERPAPNSTFDVHNVRLARRVAPDGTFTPNLIAVIVQRRAVAVDPQDPEKGFFWFRGGATLIIDPREGREEIRYVIIKNCGSDKRLVRQREMASQGTLSPLRALYFGGGAKPGTALAEPFAMMHAGQGDPDNG
jgi:hypothetical protein